MTTFSRDELQIDAEFNNILKAMPNTTTVTLTIKDRENNKRKATEPLEVKRKRTPSTKPRTNQNDSAEASEDVPPKKRKNSVEEIEVDITKPEPPSKKALRRLKKSKPVPSKSGAETNSEPDDKQPKKAEAEKRSGHGIWMGNLPWDASKADVLEFLTVNSSIAPEAITRIHMPGASDDGHKSGTAGDSKPRRKQQQNKGFAYVDLAVPEAVLTAIALSERLMSGRRVLIKDAKSFEGRPQKIKDESRNGGKSPSKRIFVGNLRYDTTAEGLRGHFELCGTVDDVMMATFEDSGKCKGFAFITFNELEAAEAAVRGWVLVEEEDEEEGEEEEMDDDGEDARDDGEDGEDSTADLDVDENRRSGPPRMKKSFVDKIDRRPVRREFAEDPQVRYKKRYGKDGTKAKTDAGIGAGGVDLETTEEAL